MKSLVFIFRCLLMLNLMLHCEQAEDYRNCPDIDTNEIFGGFCLVVDIYKGKIYKEDSCIIKKSTEFKPKKGQQSWKRTEPVCQITPTKQSMGLHGILPYQELKCFCPYGDADKCMDTITNVVDSYCWEEIRNEIKDLLSRKSEKTTEGMATTRSSSTGSGKLKTVGTKTTRNTTTATMPAITTLTPSTTKSTTTTTTAATTTTTTTTTKTTTSTTSTTTSATTTTKTPVSTSLNTTLSTTPGNTATIIVLPATASTILATKSWKKPNFTKVIKSTTTLTEKSTESVFNPTAMLTKSPQVTETTTSTEEPGETTTTEVYDPGRITTIWITREREYRRKLKELDNQLIERLAILFTLMTIILLIQARLFEKLRDHLEFYSYGQRRSVPPIP